MTRNQQRVSELKKAISDLDEQITAKKTERQHILDSIAEQRTTIAEATKRIAELKKEITKISTQIEDEERQLNDAKAELVTVTTQIDKAKAKVAEAEKQLTRAQVVIHRRLLVCRHDDTNNEQHEYAPLARAPGTHSSQSREPPLRHHGTGPPPQGVAG